MKHLLEATGAVYDVCELCRAAMGYGFCSFAGYPEQAEAEYWERVALRLRQRPSPGREIRAMRGRASTMKLDDPEAARLLDQAILVGVALAMQLGRPTRA